MSTEIEIDIARKITSEKFADTLVRAGLIDANDLRYIESIRIIAVGGKPLRMVVTRFADTRLLAQEIVEAMRGAEVIDNG